MEQIKCAIYTRKSNEEGLEKEFNTLEAQRNAGENYILSQIHQGWTLVEKHYDDGGYSGGNMNRPALQELLEDIRKGEVNMIVVYKIDRLTRSLLDFSKMIEVLDTYHCSFVSVTQNFNTADSMGRLMLNVLLSFAQFEREISGERIRDKVAMSRKKGMWTGGRVPLGYDVENKKLVVNEKEVKIVRKIFDLFNNGYDLLQICDELKSLNMHPKQFKSKESPREFKPAYLDYILHNPIYIGLMPFKGQTYQGQHEAIISEEDFKKAASAKKSFVRTKQTMPNEGLLNNLLECGCCESKMRISSTQKAGKRYRYYVSIKALKGGYRDCELKSIPAGEIETLILKQIAPLFKNHELILKLAQETKSIDRSCQEREVRMAMLDFGEVFNNLTFSQQQELLSIVIEKIVVYSDYLMINFTPGAVSIMDDEGRQKLLKMTRTMQVDFSFCHVKGRRKIIDSDGKNVTDMKTQQTILKALLRAFAWNKKLEQEGISIEELAKKEGVDKGYLGKIVRLTILAPDIVTAILESRIPPRLTLETFIRKRIPYIWEEQRITFGFKN